MENQTEVADADLLADIAEVNAKDKQYCDTHFDLGSIASHIRRLDFFASPRLRAAVVAGRVRVVCPSAYHCPHYELAAQ